MKQTLELFNPSFNRKRWVAYFDLLGVSSLIKSNRIFEVFCAYNDVQEEAKRRKSRFSEVEHIWFSDTFIFYTQSNSIRDFVFIEEVSRWFIFYLILNRIPVRGAISCDEFYTDSKNGFFLGKALVEAYEYGENQNWIGLLLCPSASAQVKTIEQLEAIGNLAHSYRLWDIPFKNCAEGTYLNLPACVFDRHTEVCIDILRDMMDSIEDSKIKEKYSYTIDFLEQNNRISKS
jgi:hypothetical protein